MGDFGRRLRTSRLGVIGRFKIAMKHLNILKIVGVIICLFIFFLGGDIDKGNVHSYLSVLLSSFTGG